MERGCIEFSHVWVKLVVKYKIGPTKEKAIRLVTIRFTTESSYVLQIRVSFTIISNTQ